MKVLKRLLKNIIGIILYPFRAIYKGIAYLVRVIVNGIRAVVMGILRSPLKTYRRVARWRDWLLAKVEYLQGEADIPTSYTDGDNTLRIDLGTTPVREITIENVSVGTVFTGSALPSGTTEVVLIGGNVVSGGTSTRIEVGHLVFEKSRCKKLTLTDVQAHTLIIKGNASDGQSIAPSPGTSRMLAIGGGHHQAEAMVTSGGTYDRILIQAPSSGVNGKVDKLTLSNLYTKGGDCVLSRINAGTIEILRNEIGMGNGFATKEFTISTNVTGAHITIEDNVEVSISEPATS